MFVCASILDNTAGFEELYLEKQIDLKHQKFHSVKGGDFRDAIILKYFDIIFFRSKAVLRTDYTNVCSNAFLKQKITPQNKLTTSSILNFAKEIYPTQVGIFFISQFFFFL